MKKIVLISVLALLISSCIRDYSTLTEFVVENNSDREVKAFVKNVEAEFYKSVDTVFTIAVGSKISYKYVEDGEDSVYE
jgi:predicted DNA-binding protein (UPF0278 family)